MRISFILPDINGGGAQKMIINLANIYALQGHEVDLILFQNKGVYQDLINPNVHIVNFDKNRTFYALNHLRHYFKNNNSIDAVISSMYYINIITIFANILSGKKQKIIVTERNNFSSRIKAESLAHQITFKTLVKILYPKANHIIGISDGVCKDLQDILTPNIQIPISTIYNPVISPDYTDKIEKNIKGIFPGNVSLKLIASGRLVLQKDYPTMLKALCCYKKKYNDDFHLIILGDGILKNQLIKLTHELGLENHITFKGFVDNPLPYMKQADIFLISSAWEGFGNVIVEALYCGLKIVSTDCPSGPSEILNDGKYGMLSPVGDWEYFAKTMHKLSLLPPAPQTQKVRALDFTTEKIALQFQRVIEGRHD